MLQTETTNSTAGWAVCTHRSDVVRLCVSTHGGLGLSVYAANSSSKAYRPISCWAYNHRSIYYTSMPITIEVVCL